MLAGQYPADEFADLKPRVVWDRVAGTVQSRRDARTVAVISGGTIPDRGLFPVFLAERRGAAEADRGPGTRARAARTGGRRVGELDEEMVYEARDGEVILLGASAWRIEHIEHDRVLVSPAPGEPGKIPFWKGDGVGRPIELGRAWARSRARSDELAASGETGRRTAIERLRGRPRPRRLRGPEPAGIPRRGARGDRRAADRPDDRAPALPRRAGRLADLPAHAVRGAGSRAVGPGDRGEAARDARAGGAADLVGRRHRDPAAGDRRDDGHGGSRRRR